MRILGAKGKPWAEQKNTIVAAPEQNGKQRVFPGIRIRASAGNSQLLSGQSCTPSSGKGHLPTDTCTCMREFELIPATSATKTLAARCVILTAWENHRWVAGAGPS